MPYPPNINVAATPLAPIPPSYTMAIDEARQMALDMTPLLGVGESVSSVTTTLTDRSVGRGTNITIPSPGVATPIVTQQLNGSLLTLGHVYWLRFKVTTSFSTTWTQIITIFCPA